MESDRRTAVKWAASFDIQRLAVAGSDFPLVIGVEGLLLLITAPTESKLYRKLRRIFCLGQGKMRRCVRHARMAEKHAHQESLIARDVGCHDPQKIVPIFRHRVTIHDFRPAGDKCFKRLRAFGRRLRIRTLQIAHTAIELGRIEQPNCGVEIAFGFEHFHAAPAKPSFAAQSVKVERKPWTW